MAERIDQMNMPTRWTLIDWVTWEICMYSVRDPGTALDLAKRFGEVVRVIPDPWGWMRRRGGVGPLLLLQSTGGEDAP